VASVLLVVALVTAAPRMVTAYRALAPTFGDGLGVTLLGLAYLPNAAVGALSWAVGAGFSVGSATMSPFDAKPGVPSSFPLLAALPTGVPPVWAPAVLALPVIVGLLVGLSVRRALPVPADRIRATVVAGLVAASGATLLALLAGGRLAAGPYDPVRFPPELVAPATLLWVGGVAAVVAILRRPDENPEYAEVVDEGARPPAEEAVEETAESAADHAEDEVEDDVEEQADESVEPVDDDEVDTPAADDLDDEDDDTDDTDDTERLTPERDAPPVEAVDVDPPPAAAVAPRRRKVFRRRAAEPPAPKRPRTVADLVAERAAAERAAREDDAQ
jgi:Family of unknown function (DUF6350)